MKSDFERTINCNKHQSEVSKQAHNKYFDYLIDSMGQIDILLYRLKIMQLEENTQGVSSESENKSGRTFFDQSVNNDLRTYDFINDQRDYSTNNSLLDYPYFQE